MLHFSNHLKSGSIMSHNEWILVVFVPYMSVCSVNRNFPSQMNCPDFDYNSWTHMKVNLSWSLVTSKHASCIFMCVHSLSWHALTAMPVFILLQLTPSCLSQLCLYSSNPVVVSSGAAQHSWPNPPPHEEVARVARYVVHISGKNLSLHPHLGGWW